MRIKITIPYELYAAIKAKAVANCRTLSQEICYVLSGSQRNDILGQNDNILCRYDSDRS